LAQKLLVKFWWNWHLVLNVEGDDDDDDDGVVDSGHRRIPDDAVDSDEEKDGGNSAEDADGEPATEFTKTSSRYSKIATPHEDSAFSEHGGGAVDS
jgi:hypothetical protein